jgi:hypothetical protein
MLIERCTSKRPNMTAVNRSAEPVQSFGEMAFRIGGSFAGRRRLAFVAAGAEPCNQHFSRARPSRRAGPSGAQKAGEPIAADPVPAK